VPSKDLNNLQGTTRQFIFASKPYSKADTAPYYAPQVQFSALPLRKFKNFYDPSTEKKGKVTVEFTNRASSVLLGRVNGVEINEVCTDIYGNSSIDTSIVAGSTDLYADKKLCCTPINNLENTDDTKIASDTNDPATVLKTADPANVVGVCKSDPTVACDTTEELQQVQRNLPTPCDVCKQDFSFYVNKPTNVVAAQANSTSGVSVLPFSAGDHQLCLVMTSTTYPFKTEATILENTIEIASARSRRDNAVDNEVDMFVYDRAQRQDDNRLPIEGMNFFLDIDDMTMTVRIGNDDNGDTEVVIETQTQQNGDMVDNGDSTTVPLVETPANKGMTTTLLGLIVGAILVLLVIVIVSIMMLRKRQEVAASKVYPFWMPGTDVSSTDFVKSTQA
jgi:hypothetical protein